MKDHRTRGVTLQNLRKKVFDYYGFECWLCGQDGADTIDHVLPLALGGGDELDNLRPAHGRKSKNCVGNFSRKRPAFVNEKLPHIKPVSDEADGITYGDGWVRKKRGHMISTMYYTITGMDLDHPFVQDFVRGN
jgi:hypothetical protein